jgi:RNA polymerase sigma-B factor
MSTKGDFRSQASPPGGRRRAQNRRAQGANRQPEGAALESLFRRLHDGADEAAREAAREELVTIYLPLARNLARRYARSSESYEDLTQVASLALVKAVDRFDPDRGSEFASFAVPTILGELKRYFRDSSWAIHVPRGVQERALAIEEAQERLTNRDGRSPSVAAIAEHLEMSVEEVLDGLQASQAYSTLSLDAPQGSRDDESDLTVAETIGSEDERYELIDADLSIAQVARTLPERERRILYLRFVKEMTQSEIAGLMGVSQMQISRLLRRSLARLRERSGSKR